MKVKMKVDVSGTRNGHPWPGRGEVVDLPTGEAEHLITHGMAERVDERPKHRPVEYATAPPAEVSTPDTSTPETATASGDEKVAPAESKPEPEKTVPEPERAPAKRGPGRPRKTTP